MNVCVLCVSGGMYLTYPHLIYVTEKEENRNVVRN